MDTLSHQLGVLAANQEFAFSSSARTQHWESAFTSPVCSDEQDQSGFSMGSMAKSQPSDQKGLEIGCWKHGRSLRSSNERRGSPAQLCMLRALA